jgi:hypothetical protein
MEVYKSSILDYMEKRMRSNLKDIKEIENFFSQTQGWGIITEKAIAAISKYNFEE